MRPVRRKLATSMLALLFGSAAFCAMGAGDEDDAAEEEDEVLMEDVGAVEPPPAANAQSAVVSDGTRLEIAEKGFSIVPPQGWEIRRDYPNTSLLMQIPARDGIDYQRNIQVLAMSKPMALDDLQIDKFEEFLVKSFTAVDIGIENYRIRNHTLVDLPSHPLTPETGVLFYAEFSVNGHKVMQAHLLVTSATRHYLLTFTDLAEHFEGEEANNHLNEAWLSMTSIAVDALAAGRFEVPLKIFGVVFSMFIIGFVTTRIRNERMYRKFRQIADETNEIESKFPAKSRKPASAIDALTDWDVEALADEGDELESEEKWNLETPKKSG